jgi:plastocyanin
MPSRFRRSSSKGWLHGLPLALAAIEALGASGGAFAEQHTVTIDGLQYAPAAISVARGDTVVWVNKDPFPHTVTARGAFDSREIAAGQSWKYTARKSGTFEYVCTLHPNMKGTLTVK